MVFVYHNHKNELCIGILYGHVLITIWVHRKMDSVKASMEYMAKTEL